MWSARGTTEALPLIRKLIDISQPVDRAFLVAAPLRSSEDVAHADYHLDELARLANTAGAQVVGRVVQRVEAPKSATYIGRGKIDELRERLDEADASLILFDEELSPAQGRNLENVLGRRVMDRSELILDIFATRARSKDAKLQVELAQLEYLLPRLARMWVHLSRIRGGIGLRGPGETQLESDRRLIRRRISRLKRLLRRVSRHRELLRHARRSIPTAALVGYTNAGKSSLLRALTGAETFVEDRLFATLDTLTREMYLGPGRQLRLIDSVGFIRKLPHHLVASFRATLDEVLAADFLLHVVDASQIDWEEQLQVVDRVVDDLGAAAVPMIHVFNKMDRVPEPASFRQRVAALNSGAVFVSALRGEVSELTAAVSGFVLGSPAPYQ